MRLSILISTVLTISIFSLGLAASEAPFKVHEFTLDNGLKVFFTQNKEKPEFYSEVIVRAGSKHEPADATGLAHYLEHLLFKGTTKIGSLDYEKEAELNDKIIALYDQRFNETDQQKRADLLQKINELSVKAAKHIKVGEYDKLMSRLGQMAVNAHTGKEETVYYNQMPSNRFDQWASIEAERFMHPVIARTFQWELEIVYEEKNRAANSASNDAFLKGVFPTHPYARDTLGTTEHLKNPSISKVQKFFDAYYVPNNTAIAISGDLELEQVKRVIKKHFGSWKAKTLPEQEKFLEEPIKNRKQVNVSFKGKPIVKLGYRTPGIQSSDIKPLRMLNKILSNSEVGVLKAMNRQQKLTAASSFLWELNDYSLFILGAAVRNNETHDEVERKLLAIIESIKNGEFDIENLNAIKKDETKKMQLVSEKNHTRIELIRERFVLGLEWSNIKKDIKSFQDITKSDIIRVAKKYLSDGFVASHQINKSVVPAKIKAPEITDLDGIGSKENSSRYHELIAKKSELPDPQFANLYDKVQKEKSNKATYIVSKNKKNNLATLQLNFKYGSKDSIDACLFFNNLEYADSKVGNASLVKKKLFSIGLQSSISCDINETTISLGGLDESIEEGLGEFLQFLTSANISNTHLEKIKSEALADRKIIANDPKEIKQAIKEYLINGDLSKYKLIPNNTQIQNMSWVDYKKHLKNLKSSNLEIFYTGKKTHHALKDIIDRKVDIPVKKEQRRELRRPVVSEVSKPTIYFFQRPNMPQAMVNLLVPGQTFQPANVTSHMRNKLFINFYATGLSSVVVQEIREKRALAYSAGGGIRYANYPGEQNILVTGADCQPDKLVKTVQTLHSILTNVPLNKSIFDTAKDSLLTEMKTKRVNFRNRNLFFNSWSNRGYKKDPRQERFSVLQKLEIDGLRSHIKTHFSSKHPQFFIVGDRNNLDLETLKDSYEFIELTEKDVFNF